MKLEKIIASVFIVVVLVSAGGLIYFHDQTLAGKYYNHYDTQCAERLGSDWQAFEVTAPPNQDKDTATVLCVKGNPMLPGDDATIEATPYSAKD